MEDALVLLARPAAIAELANTLELAADFARASKAKSTLTAYGSDWRVFECWCEERSLAALPASPEGVCGFLADEASRGRRASTLGRRLAAIRYFHRAAGFEPPTAQFGVWLGHHGG
jgi:site-specific recombinase XerD